jgi:hypothetical protein
VGAYLLAEAPGFHHSLFCEKAKRAQTIGSIPRALIITKGKLFYTYFQDAYPKKTALNGLVLSQQIKPHFKYIFE